MSNTIRIGTRDSELALWQANYVKRQLDALGHKTKIIAVKSTGDIILDKPLYELGITGIFTKTLDIAMLSGDIDIAVHSMKDVPTALPKGIVQAAVLKRANSMDILAFNDNEEFLGAPEAIIATGSLRRKAQWLNRFPTHTVVDLRGNVNSRMQKLENSNWNGAIFAAAGLDRINLETENTVGLTWMTPAPAQGALMIVAREENEELREILAELNHEATETCVTIEREFLRTLEGGCTAPIGAFAYINKEDEVVFKGVLLSKDGKQKIEVAKTVKLGKHLTLGEDCANKVLEKGGKRLMGQLNHTPMPAQVYATKKLTAEQAQMFDSSVKVDSEDFIKINLTRIPRPVLKAPHKNVIFTSKNGIEALIQNVTAGELQFDNIYCVGRKTKRLIEKRIGEVTFSAPNAKKLAEYLADNLETKEVTYFCGDIRLDELPTLLAENNIEVTEIEAYKTTLAPREVEKDTKAILFFSPSGVQSYMQINDTNKTAYCIGETTAEEARKHFTEVKVADMRTVESVVALANADYQK
ncbi:hydroxymethylbilane synthase [Maribacter sp.]|uniref:hydroxymethylbilane synthase n=1 Tax=Maribacter sp. TaxID=1897614 RepID=UPI0025C030CB|nr:hydroxymethylbilane synthase [Maribacter sp.]